MSKANANSTRYKTPTFCWYGRSFSSFDFKRVLSDTQRFDRMADFKSEEDKHSALSCALFTYMSPLLALGFQRQLNAEDLPQLYSADRCEACVNALDEHWRYEL
jgi:hypothetical protein